jgi:adenylate cyclase
MLLAMGAVLGWCYARLTLVPALLLTILCSFACWQLAHLAFSRAGWRVEVVPLLLLGGFTFSATFALRWRALRRLFGVVQSEAVARALESDPQRLDLVGEECEATVLFADVRRFTDFSEKHTADEVQALLNAYFRVVVPAIEEQGGTVSNLMGDGLMALFGVPDRQPDHARRAVVAAVEMVRRVHAHRHEWQALDRQQVWGEAGLCIGVGVHSGKVVVGAVGSRQRQAYTAVGDAVNAAARIEAENKHWGTEILVSAAALALVPAQERAALGLAEVPVAAAVKGKDEKLMLYPVAVP